MPTLFGLMVRWRGRITAAVVSTVCAAGIFAQENPAKSEARPAATTGIADAQKDFESLKSVRDAALLPKGEMPRVALPPLPSPSGTTVPVTKSTVAPPDAKSRTWLLDAMQKSERSTDTKALRSRSRGIERDSSERGIERNSSEEKHGEIARSGEGTETRDAPAVINPLTRYLGDWMTPQDYALLKPGLMQSLDGVRAKTSSDTTMAVTTPLPRGLDELLPGGSATPPLSIAQSPKENPFLAALRLDPPAPAASVVNALKAIPPVAAPTPIVNPASAAPAPIQPAPTKIPEFAKPPTDDKYFKQLKRF